MASNETILAWKAELQGADNVKDGLRKINEEVKKGSLTQTEANKVIQVATKDTRNFRAEQNLLNRSFMSTHPNLDRLTRSFSTMAHVARTGLTIANSLNLMWIRQGQNKQTLAELTYSATLAEREYLDMVKKFGPDSRQAREALEKWNLEKSKASQFKIETDSQGWLDIASNIFMVVLGGNQLLEIFKKFPGLTGKILPALTGLFSGILPFLGEVAISIASIGAWFIALPAAMALLAAPIADFLVGLFGLDEWRKNNGILLEQFFTQTIPTALGQAALFLTNFFLTELPAWISIAAETINGVFLTMWDGITNLFVLGFEFIKTQIASFIESIKRFISDIINLFKTISFAGGGGSSVGGGGNNVQANPWGLNTKPKKSATGFNGMVNGPTVFLAGEAGPEQVSITPSGRNTGSGGGITVVVNVQGSILTERELFRRVDENLKNELRKRNFRILQ